MTMYIKDTLKASISGNAGTATKLATARTITVGSTGKTFDGSGNVSWSLAEIGAIGADTSGTYVGMTTPNGSTSSWIRTTSSGIIPSDQNKASSLGTSSWQFKAVYAETHYGALSGNATTATTLQTTRTINGTNFNGSSNITTANWGTARTITVGNTGKSVNGSGNISWTLAEIGAFPSSGGNVSGSIHLSTDNTKISGVCGGGTDRWNIQGGGTNDNGYLEISTADNGNEPIYVRQYDTNGLVRTAALLDGNGATSFPGLISEGGTKLTDKYAAKSHGHNSISVKDAPYSSSNDTTSNWGSQGVCVAWYPDGTTITNKPNSWGFILNIGRASEVHQMWFTQATGTAYHRGGNGSGWSGSWRAFLDSENYSSYAAPASHSHSYLPLSGGTLSGPVTVSGESRFHNGTYTDPLNGTACAIKVTGKIAATGEIISSTNIRVNGKRLSITASAPGSPSTGDIWIDI